MPPCSSKIARRGRLRERLADVRVGDVRRIEREDAVLVAQRRDVARARRRLPALVGNCSTTAGVAQPRERQREQR